MRHIQKILFALLMVFFILPGTQMVINYLPEKPLNGVYIEQKLPKWDQEQWFSFGYQQKLDKYLDQNFGFRPYFIRLFNQVEYTLFKRSHGEGIVIGEDNYLYESWYIIAYTGRWVDKKNADSKIQKLSGIKDYLEQYDTRLLVVLAPGKGHYYPDFFPDRYKRTPALTYYDYYRDIISKTDIPCVDFNSLFMQLKDTISYPLFPQTGTHWSDYGATLASDSLLYFIEDLLHKEMTHFNYDSIEVTDDPRNTDDDLEKTLNLLCKTSEVTLAYPVLSADTTSNLPPKPSAVVIADSYFWQLFNGPFNWSFSNLKYWYYFSSIYPDSYRERITTSEIDILEQVKSTDLLMILVSPANLKRFDFGFINKVDSLIQEEKSINLSGISIH